MRVEKAKIGDAPSMHKLINRFAAQGEMLPRALSAIYELIRDYFVVKDGDELVACVHCMSLGLTLPRSSPWL